MQLGGVLVRKTSGFVEWWRNAAVIESFNTDRSIILSVSCRCKRSMLSLPPEFADVNCRVMLVMTILEAVATFGPPASPVYTIMIVIPSFALRNIAACHVYRKTKLGVISDGSFLTSSSPSRYFTSTVRFISNLPSTLAGIPSPVEMRSMPLRSPRTLVTESRGETVDGTWNLAGRASMFSSLPHFTFLLLSPSLPLNFYFHLYLS